MISLLKYRIVFPLAMIVMAEGASSESGWQWQYPKPQGNTLNDIFVFDENRAVAVGDLGTVIRTKDGGETWEVQHHAGGTALPLYGVFFIDEEFGWAAGGTWWTDQRVLLKTEDGGATWTIVETQTEGYALPFQGVYFVSADTGFVFGEDGLVLRTTDGGTTWNSQIIGFALHRLNSACFLDKETGWIVGYGFYGNTIFKTTDCGLTWEQQSLETRVFNQTDVQFIDDSTGFIVGQMGTFLKTTDGGQTWEYHDLFEKYQDAEYQYFYSVFFVNADTGWIAGGDYYGYILKTIDGGENWFEEIRIPECHLYKIRFSDQENGWAVGLYGFIYRTTDEGANWIPQREDRYSFSSIHFIDENTGWVVGNSNTSSILDNRGVILHTSDGGKNWHKQNDADSILFSSVYAVDSHHVFAVGSVIEGLSVLDTKGIVFKTIDGGKIWKKQPFDTLYGFHSIVFVDDSTGWISGVKGTLLTTTDRGNTWKKINFDGHQAEGKIQFINENIGWIGGTLKTVDGGKNWCQQLIDTSFGVYDFYFINPDQGWSVGNYEVGKGHIFKTDDGGNNWALCGRPPSTYYYAVHFINEKIGWVAGNAIIKTSDGGNTWIKQKSPSMVSSIYFYNENTGWAVGDGIFLTTDGGGVVSIYDEKKQNNNLPKQMELFQNYPNPFNATTTIHFELSFVGSVELKVLNILGEEVATWVDKNLDAGSHRIIWNASQRASGIYFCRLEVRYLNHRVDRNFYKTKKMILLQ